MGAIPMTIGSGVMQSIGQIEGGEAQAHAAEYNADIAKQNATVANANAALVSQATEGQVTNTGIKNKAIQGALKTNTAAGGLSVNSGSPTNVRGTESELGQLDAYNVRAEGVKQAYGYQVQAENLTAQQKLDTFEAHQDEEAGTLAATGTMLGSIGKAEDMFSQFMLQGGLGGG